MEVTATTGAKLQSDYCHRHHLCPTFYRPDTIVICPSCRPTNSVRALKEKGIIDHYWLTLCLVIISWSVLWIPDGAQQSAGEHEFRWRWSAATGQVLGSCVVTWQVDFPAVKSRQSVWVGRRFGRTRNCLAHLVVRSVRSLRWGIIPRFWYNFNCFVHVIEAAFVQWLRWRTCAPWSWVQFPSVPIWWQQEGHLAKLAPMVPQYLGRHVRALEQRSHTRTPF